MAFLILSLPRSRSAWLAHFLGCYPGAIPPQPVGHDIMLNCDSVQQFIDSYKHGMWGTCETGAAAVWRVVREALPDLKIVLIRRPMIEVFQSIANMGAVANLEELAEQDYMLDSISRVEGVHSVPYAHLESPLCCEWLFEYCQELEFDFEWWVRMNMTNVQVDWKHREGQLLARRAAVQHFKGEAAYLSKGLLAGCLN